MTQMDNAAVILAAGTKTARCCRDWPVYYLWIGWRTCGECGRIPILVEES